MNIRQAIVTAMIAMASYPKHKIVVDAFVPTSILTPRVLSTTTNHAIQSIAPTLSTINNRLSITTRSRSTKSALQMSSSQDFDQQQYTDASWSAISTLPQCADYYSATSVDAPMLLAILLNPTKYQASENASTAKQVVTKLLNDANVNVDKLKDDVEEYLQKQPTVSGDTSTQKSMGRTLGEVLEAGRGVRDGLKVCILCISCAHFCVYILIHLTYINITYNTYTTGFVHFNRGSPPRTMCQRYIIHNQRPK